MQRKKMSFLLLWVKIPANNINPGCILDIRDFSCLLLFESSIGWVKRQERKQKHTFT